MADFSPNNKYNYLWQSSKFQGLSFSGSNISQFINDAGYITSTSTINTGSFITTSSFNIYTSSISSQFAGTSSYALTAQTLLGSVTSASYASTASLAPLYLPLTGGTISGNVTVLGTASVAFLNVQYESASIIYSSGSNQFGDATNDIQTLIGTVIVSGSQQVTGSLNVTGGITGSLSGTASYALNALSASYAPNTSPFPYTGSALITGSLGVTGSITATQIGIGAAPSGSTRLDIRAQGTATTDIAFRVRNTTDTFNLLQTNGSGLTTFTTTYPAGGVPTINIVGSGTNVNPYLQVSSDGNISTAYLVAARLGGTGGVTSTGTNRSYLYLSNAAGEHNVIGSNDGLAFSAFGHLGYDPVVDQMRLKNGNLGIGTGYSAAARLDVKAQGALSTDIAFRVRNSVDTANLISIQGNNVGNFSKVYFDLNSGTPQLVNTDTSAATGASILLGTTTISLRDSNANFVRFIGGGVKSIAVNNGSANTGLADAFELYSADIVAGNAAPHFQTENGNVVKLYAQAPVTSSQGIADTLTNLGFLTGSSVINPTSSYAITASYALTAQTLLGSVTSASYASTASYVQTAQTASYVNGMITKNNEIINTSFTGTPRKATVTFTTSFPNTSYSVVVTGEDLRSWTIESKLTSGFTINTNSNDALTGATYWQATNYGEFRS